MNESTHLPYWTLEQLAEGSLSHAERGLAEAHLRRCAACTAELEGARALIVALEGLPQFEPSPAFADAVMARVQVKRAPAPAPLAAKARRWLPGTRRGWLRAGGMAGVPVAAFAALLAWMVTNPALPLAQSMGAAGVWMRGAVRTGVVQGVEALVRVGAFRWYFELAGSLSLSPQALGVSALLLAVATPLSAAAVVRLLKAPMKGMTHAH